MLLIEVDGDVSTLKPQVEVIRRVCEQLGMVDFHVAETAEEAEQLWVARRSGLPDVYKRQGFTVPSARERSRKSLPREELDSSYVLP